MLKLDCSVLIMQDLKSASFSKCSISPSIVVCFKDTETADTEVKEETGLPKFEATEEIPPIPTEGVSYTRMEEEEVNKLVEHVTAVVYQRVSVCLYTEHRLLFATLLCLSMQEEANSFSEEELSLLLQG